MSVLQKDGNGGGGDGGGEGGRGEEVPLSGPEPGLTFTEQHTYATRACEWWAQMARKNDDGSMAVPCLAGGGWARHT